MNDRVVLQERDAVSAAFLGGARDLVVKVDGDSKACGVLPATQLMLTVLCLDNSFEWV